VKSAFVSAHGLMVGPLSLGGDASSLFLAGSGSDITISSCNFTLLSSTSGRALIVSDNSSDTQGVTALMIISSSFSDLNVFIYLFIYLYQFLFIYLFILIFIYLY
jgi:hypothetical protein